MSPKKPAATKKHKAPAHRAQRGRAEPATRGPVSTPEPEVPATPESAPEPEATFTVNPESAPAFTVNEPSAPAADAFTLNPSPSPGGWTMVPATRKASTRRTAPDSAPTPTATGAEAWTANPAAAAWEISKPMGAWTERGLPWAATIGWVVLVVGLFLPAYMYSWAVDNGADFEPFGIKGTYIAIAVILIGLGVGLAFTFLPAVRSVSWSATVPPQWVRVRLSELQRNQRIALVLTLVGVGLTAMGMMFAAWIHIQHLRADEGATEFTMAGSNLSFSTWAGIGYMVAVIGVVLDLVFYFRMGAYRETMWAARTALERAGVATPMGAGATFSGDVAAGVAGPQVQALMRRIDGLLANLPEDVVADFSKTPEADTYLRILGDKGR